MIYDGYESVRREPHMRRPSTPQSELEVNHMCTLKLLKITVVFKSPMFWDITPCSPLKSTDVSDEFVSSIFEVEE
jgi:hypothetical protein